MKQKLILLSGVLLMLLSLEAKSQATTPAPEPNTAQDTLLVVWSSGDPEVAEKVCFMYTLNAKKRGWFKEVIFVIWGPSQKLLAENEELQSTVLKMMDEGVIVEGCVACAKMYGIDGSLKEMGVDVKGMGTVLTKYLKAGYPNITF